VGRFEQEHIEDFKMSLGQPLDAMITKQTETMQAWDTTFKVQHSYHVICCYARIGYDMFLSVHLIRVHTENFVTWV
jgi:hypothetical protein